MRSTKKQRLGPSLTRWLNDTARWRAMYPELTATRLAAKVQRFHAFFERQAETLAHAEAVLNAEWEAKPAG